MKKGKKEITWASAWMMPKGSERANAVGFRDEPIPPAFQPSDHFQIIPEPTHEDDFLAQSPPEKQTFRNWEQKFFSSKNRPKHKHIYIVPLGTFPDFAPPVQAVADYCRAFYHPLQVSCLDSLPIFSKKVGAKQEVFLDINSLSKHIAETADSDEDSDVAEEYNVTIWPLESRRCHKYDLNRVPKNHTQICVSSFLNILPRLKPPDAFCILGVTMYDLYAGADDSFCVGMAGPYFSGVFSFARYNPRFLEPKGTKLTEEEKKLFLLRSCKVAAHEIAHNVGVDHCCYYQCMMNGSGHLLEDFAQPIFLCPVDLRKIVEFTGSSVLERYHHLLEYFKTHNMQTEEDWVKTRVQWITENDNQDISQKKGEPGKSRSRDEPKTAEPKKREAVTGPRRSERLSKRTKL